MLDFLHKKVVLYLVFMLVLSFEIGVLVLAKFPQVSRMYQAHFIDKSVKCWSSGNPQPLKMHEPVSFTLKNIRNLCHYLGEGWAYPAADGLWSNGKRAVLLLPLEDVGQDLVFVQMTAWAYAPKRKVQTIEIFLGGEKQKTINLLHGRDKVVSFQIPSTLLQDRSVVRIEFNIQNPVPVFDHGETMLFGFAFSNLQLVSSPFSRWKR